MNLGGLYGNGMPKVIKFDETVDLMLAVRDTSACEEEMGDLPSKLRRR